MTWFTLGNQEEEVRFATDSLVEKEGSEPSVPIRPVQTDSEQAFTRELRIRVAFVNLEPPADQAVNGNNGSY